MNIVLADVIRSSQIPAPLFKRVLEQYWGWDALVNNRRYIVQQAPLQSTMDMCDIYCAGKLGIDNMAEIVSVMTHDVWGEFGITAYAYLSKLKILAHRRPHEIMSVLIGNQADNNIVREVCCCLALYAQDACARAVIQYLKEDI